MYDNESYQEKREMKKGSRGISLLKFKVKVRIICLLSFLVKRMIICMLSIFIDRTVKMKLSGKIKII